MVAENPRQGTRTELLKDLDRLRRKASPTHRVDRATCRWDLITTAFGPDDGISKVSQPAVKIADARAANAKSRCNPRMINPPTKKR